MATVPIRGLAAKGILRDPAPYELDLDAWSNGMNVRFHANKAERAPVWRTVEDSIPDEPVFCLGIEPTGNGYDSVMTVATDGRIWQYGAGTFTEVTEVGHTNSTDPRAYTGCFCANVCYINRPDQAPRYFGPQSSAFALLPNQECAWTCRSMRAFGDFVIALNVTKPATFTDPHTGLLQTGGAFPNLVKWSDLTLEGQVPDSWDPDDPTKSAGENPLEQLTTPIVDGLQMRDTFVIYSEGQIWGMAQVSGGAIFNFQQLFSEGGLIAPNCVVEVNGLHYCFGPKDIYRHDGTTKESIVDKRNRDTIFRFLNKAKAEVCFVSYMPQYDSILFAYNSGDNNATFPGPLCDRCNMGAVYDINADTWSFIDLPNMSALTQGNLDDIYTYASVPSTTTYANVGGTYYDQENTFVKYPIGCSSTLTGFITADRLLVYDFLSDKSAKLLPVNTECNPPAWVERVGLALDQLGSDLQTYKKVRRVFPLVSTSNNVTMQIQVGGSEVPGEAPTYAPAVAFSPPDDYKLDVVKGGRYLALKFYVDTFDDFAIAGYDLDVTNAGRR